MMEAIERLNAYYEETGRAFRIKHWGGGIRMASHPQYARFIRALYDEHRPKKLSRTLMETLSIIAYGQPTTKPEIDFVRGVDSDYAVRKLLEIGLIDIVGRSDSIGRPLLYGTSDRFLEQFGLSSLEALPKLREVEELLGDPAFKKERLHLLALEGMEEVAQAIDAENESFEADSDQDEADTNNDEESE
jgi:segregation and condensation protein B